MKIETRHRIGDVINLFGWPDFQCVVTAITVRASGQVEYQLEWNADGIPKVEWFEENRIDLLKKVTEKERRISFK